MPKHFIALTHLKQNEEYSCVPACVRMVLDHYGNHRTEAELISLLKCTPYGTTAEALRSIAQLGHEAKVSYSTFEELQNHIAAGRPVVAFLRTEPLDYWSSIRDLNSEIRNPKSEIRNPKFCHDPYFDVASQKTSIVSFKQAWWGSKNRVAIISPKVAQ